MDDFYKDALKFGCLQGFKHFSLYLRGREELLITVHHRDDPGAPVDPGPFPPDDAIHDRNGSASSRARRISDDGGSPRATSRASKRTPPSESPSTNDARRKRNRGETTFLVGAYAKYDLPYAWLRSGGSNSGGESSTEQDLPLDLDTTRDWVGGKHRVWDVAEELVRTCVFPNPTNAFAVDHDAIRKMPRDERWLTTGALVAFLRDVLSDSSAAAEKRCPRGVGAFADAVERDVDKLLASHFADVPEALLADVE